MDTAREIEKKWKSEVQVINKDLMLGHTQPYVTTYEYLPRSVRMSEPISLRNVRGIIEYTMREMDEDAVHTGARDAD